MCQVALGKVVPIYNPRPQVMRAFVPLVLACLALPFFSVFANLILHEWYLRVAWTCISLIIGDMLLISLLPCIFLLWIAFFVLCPPSCWGICLSPCLQLFNIIRLLTLYHTCFQYFPWNFCLFTSGWFSAY